MSNSKQPIDSNDQSNKKKERRKRGERKKESLSTSMELYNGKDNIDKKIFQNKLLTETLNQIKDKKETLESKLNKIEEPNQLIATPQKKTNREAIKSYEENKVVKNDDLGTKETFIQIKKREVIGEDKSEKSKEKKIVIRNETEELNTLKKNHKNSKDEDEIKKIEEADKKKKNLKKVTMDQSVTSEEKKQLSLNKRRKTAGIELKNQTSSFNEKYDIEKIRKIENEAAETIQVRYKYYLKKKKTCNKIVQTNSNMIKELYKEFQLYFKEKNDDTINNLKDIFEVLLEINGRIMKKI